jgi:CDP-glucose 4,6-dehydratase
LEDLEINLTFWENKKVFLTGHTGFKGGWITLWLNSLGAKITGYALKPPTEPNFFEITRLERDIDSTIGDVRDLSLLKKAMKAADPEIVIHMAAQPLVRYSYLNPVETYETNVLGTVNVLEAARENRNIRVILNVTSDKCYENKEFDRGYKEDEPMGGFDPYSNSKGCSELVTAGYRSSYFNNNLYKNHGVALATARAGNVIGGGDWAADRLIPDFMRAIINNQKILIRNPKAIRPWQHVLEPLQGYLILAQKLYEEGPSFAESWNFGPDDSDAKDVKWIANRFEELWGRHLNIEIHSDSSNFHETHFLKLNSNKARERLGWHPQWDIDKALFEICDWYKSYLNGSNMKEISLRTIFDRKFVD